jgi:hypothetical protein
MFTVDRRSELRAQLLDRATRDRSVTAAAITGSASVGAEDEWSDIDLFFGVDDSVGVDEAVSAWSAFVYRELGALHHFDVRAGAWTYRAFLLPDLLEIDLGFAPAEQFGPFGNGGFQVVFGEPASHRAETVDIGLLIGHTWHHILHARACIERGRLWQAEHWVSAVRDNTLALASARLGEAVSYAKGADHLPAEVTRPLRAALVASLEPAELRRALVAGARAFLNELRATDPVLADTLVPPLRDVFSDLGGWWLPGLPPTTKIWT